MVHVRRSLMLSAVVLLTHCGSSPGGNSNPTPDAGQPPDAGTPTPTAPGWTALRQLPLGVGEAALAAADGKLYVIGGYDTLPTFQVYDIASDTWTMGSLREGTDNAGAVVQSGKLYVFGGEATPAVQVFDLAQAKWSAGPNLPSPRFSSVVELVGTVVHLVGGWSFDRSNNTSLASHSAFDVTSGAYLPGPFAPLSAARNHAYSGVIGGKLYVTGGRAPGHEAEDGSNVASTEVYDPATDAWSPLPDLPTPRSGGASAVLDGKLYVLGGGLPGNTVYNAVHRFDPAAGTWAALPDMPIALTGHRAVAVGQDIYVVGGFRSTNGIRQGFGGVPFVWRYRPP
jgi:N-acetylneuraminic acid mutarotase